MQKSNGFPQSYQMNGNSNGGYIKSSRPNLTGFVKEQPKMNGHANSTLINNQATSSPVFSTKTTSPIGPINGANYSAIGNKYNNVGIGASSSQSSSPMQGGPTTYYYSSSSVPPSPSDPKQQAQSHPPQQHYRTTTTTIRSSGSTGPSKDVPDQHQPQRDYVHRSGTMPGGRPKEAPPDPPTYNIEHLASFAVGSQFNITSPADGIRKLKQMEKNSAIWAQPMLLTLYPDRVAIVDEQGESVEQFPMELIVDPTAHRSSDPQDMYNNVLLFVVQEDNRGIRASFVPTEMHIFQCVGVSAHEVAEDLHFYMKGRCHKVRPGHHISQQNNEAHIHAPTAQRGTGANYYRTEPSGNEHFEMDVNTLNRCFDDIERFVARIQSAALAQRELEAQHQRILRVQRSKKMRETQLIAQQSGILALRAQMPAFSEFHEVFQKFKLSFNLLAKLKNHIHEPNAPELLHFLFTPLAIIMDACQWGLAMNVAEQVYSPLLSVDACELLQNCLTSKEHDIWMALGHAWRTPPEDWPGPLPHPFRPVFFDGYAPYGYPTQVTSAVPETSQTSHVPPTRYNSEPPPIHRGMSAPLPQSTAYVDNLGPRGGPTPPVKTRSSLMDVQSLELERLNLEKERVEFERRKVLDREQELLEHRDRLFEHERRLREQEERLEDERKKFQKEVEKQSIAGSDRPDFYRSTASISVQQSPKLTSDRRTASIQALPYSNGHSSRTFRTENGTVYSALGPKTPQSSSVLRPGGEDFQQEFFDELARRSAKIVQVTYDRVSQNPKELSVNRGEYLEVLQDKKNWWECRNAYGRVGFVPHTILSVVESADTRNSISTKEPFYSPDSINPRINAEEVRQNNTARPGTSSTNKSGSETPDYIRQRRGKNGEFRYF